MFDVIILFDYWCVDNYRQWTVDVQMNTDLKEVNETNRNIQTMLCVQRQSHRYMG